jgi:hypothetical protein
VFGVGFGGEAGELAMDVGMAGQGAGMVLEGGELVVADAGLAAVVEDHGDLGELLDELEHGVHLGVGGGDLEMQAEVGEQANTFDER